MDLSADQLRAKFTAKCWATGQKDRLNKEHFKTLVLELYKDSNQGLPSDKDLDTAFVIADQDKNNAVDVFEFIRLCSLVAKGEVTGLGKGGAKSKKKFRGSMLGKGLTLQPGMDVTWKGADEDLPAGTVGKVLCVHDDGDVEVVFPTAAGPTTFAFRSDNLEVYNGKSDSGILQVSLGELALDFSLDVPLGMDFEKLTLSVRSTTPGGQADKLGVFKGWRVVRLNFKPVSTFDDFVEILQQFKEQGASTASLSFVRNEVNEIAVNKDAESFRESVFGDSNDECGDNDSMVGYLHKKGDNVVSPWQSRWFEVTGHYLKYYKSFKVAGKKDYCLAAVDLNLCEITDAAGRSFSVVPNAKAKATMSLKASDDAAATAWVAALRRCKDDLQESTQQDNESNGDAVIAVNSGGNTNGIYEASVPSSSGGPPPTALIYNEFTNRVESNPDFKPAPAATKAPAAKAAPAPTVPVPAPRTATVRADRGVEADVNSSQVGAMKQPTLLPPPAPKSLTATKSSSSISSGGVNVIEGVNAQIESALDVGPTDASARDTMVAAAAPSFGLKIPPKDSLSAKLTKEELKRQVVPEHLKPKGSAVNQPGKAALQTGHSERRVARRRSVTALKCCATLPMDGGGQEATCSVYHLRESPFCHTHSDLDPKSRLLPAPDVTELEVALSRAVEDELDHAKQLPPNAFEEGTAIRAEMSSSLQAEFEDPVEVFQLKRQFQVLLATGGDANDDGLIQAAELLECARNVGDLLLPDKVNMEWASTVIAGMLGLESVDQLLPEAGSNFEHFCSMVAKMRRSMKGDARCRARKLRDLTRPPDEDDPDSDSDNEDDAWFFPATVPAGAKEGSMLSVPLPGNQVGFAPVDNKNVSGSELWVPMPPEAVDGAMTMAVAAAAVSPALSSKAAATTSMTVAAAATDTIVGYVAGPGAAYVANKGRQEFCLNTFLALREAATLKADLPPLEGWMLKRGDAFSIGNLNAWKLRYFRLEGDELVYYEKMPGRKWAVDNVVVNKEGRYGSLAEAEAEASARGEVLSETESAIALAAEQDEEEFTDKTLKGAINMAEVVDIQLSIKTAVTNSSAKIYYQALEKQALGESNKSKSMPVTKACIEAAFDEDGELKSSADLAENLVVFKVTTTKKRRYVLAVAYEHVVPVVAAFARHVAFARASLRFRRKFGSGIPSIKLTLAERIAWATSGKAAQMAIALLLLGYRSEYFQTKVLNYQLYNLGGIAITPARIISAFIITQSINEVYVANKYADREKKYGIEWEYKRDVVACRVCHDKFDTLAVTRIRKEEQKHHCRMCGRVVCHACASSMLFYEASGKRQRTCDECIRNGGPPPSRLASEFNQKSIITLVKEQKAAYDASQKDAESAKELPPGIQMDKHSKVATWADWGVVPETPKLDMSVEDKAAGIFLKFTVYLPIGTIPGDTVEVTLPTPEMVTTPKPEEPKRGVAAFFKSAIVASAPAPTPPGPNAEEALKGLASSVICVVGPDGSVERSNPDVPKMPVELGNGIDGIVFAMPPKQVYDIADMDAAAEKYKKEKLKNEAEGYAKMGMAVASGAKGASSGLGFGC